MSKNNVLLTTISVIIIFAFLFIVYVASNNNPTSNQVQTQLQKVLPTDHVKWGKNQKNILTEFTDFQCPACRSFYEVLKTYDASGSADAKIAEKVTFVHKHFPLDQIHRNARPSAYAAEAAGKQGKFFEMSDMLFENQKTWEGEKDPSKTFLQYATLLELDIEKFKQDVASAEVKKKVDDDVILGNQVGINSTPTFYLNGKKMEYATLDDFKKQLAEATK